jgi:hypothetical protein
MNYILVIILVLVVAGYRKISIEVGKWFKIKVEK